MNVYDYFNTMTLGLPFNAVISNYLTDLKVTIIFNKVIELLLFRYR